MNILVLCKRYYTAKDVVSDRYGRLFEIPEGLASLGHEVTAFALGYRFRGTGAGASGAATWVAGDLSPWGLIRYLRRLVRDLRRRPDIIWASSDVPHLLFALAISRVLRVPVVMDLYDDYESFGITRLLGLTALLRYACRSAEGLSVVSSTLASKVESNYLVRRPVLVLSNSARTDLFHPKDSIRSRRILGLPISARLVGTAGALTTERGVEDLWQAFLRLAEVDPDLWLILAGPRDLTSSSWSHDRMVWLGVIPLASVAEVISALDVVVVCNRDSLFGRSCFPLKLVEAIASHRPVVAADVGETSLILAAHPGSRYTPGDRDDLARKIREQLDVPRRIDVALPTWEELSRSLSRFLESIRNDYASARSA